VNVLPELNAIALVHDGPDVTEAAVVDGAFDDDGDDANEHEDGLNDVCPHDSLHTALETTHTDRVTARSADMHIRISKKKVKYALWFIKTRGSTFVIKKLWKILMDFNDFYMSGNGNERAPQVSYLVIYFTCDVNMTSLSRS